MWLKLLVIVFIAGFVRTSSFDCTKQPNEHLMITCCTLSINTTIMANCMLEADDLIHSDKHEKNTHHSGGLSKDQESIMKGVCTIDCEHEKKGFLKGENDVDMNNVKKYFNEEFPNDKEYADVFIEGYEGCVELAQIQTKFSRKKIQTPCNIFPTVLHFCVLSHYITHCPQSKWQSSKRCEQLKSYMMQCVEKPKAALTF